MDEAIARLWQEILARPSGPLALRFYLQPLMALLFAVRDGIKDARAHRPPYFWALFTVSPARRREMIRDGWGSVGKIFILALVLDNLYQIIVLHGLRPVEGLIVAILLAIIPYVWLRGPANRIAGHWMTRSGHGVTLLILVGLGLGAGVVVDRLGAREAEASMKRAGPQEDPLPSWNDGPTKRLIIDFVTRVSTEGRPEFVPASERIATFDNDGTLWPEQPVIEGVFVLEKLKAMAARDSSLRQRQPYKAVLAGDRAYLKRAGTDAILELIVATHANETNEQYQADVQRFFKTFRYPKFNLPLARVPYQPMLELLQYLRASGFETWISSGGDIDFIRVISDSLYGVPREQVIGSAFQKEFTQREGQWVLWRKPAVLTVNDKAGKPINIDLHIGKRPLLVAGNVRSGGDVAMMLYSRERAGPSLQVLINHDDSTREFAYGEPDSVSLKAARDYGFTVVSMKDDWATIFAP